MKGGFPYGGYSYCPNVLGQERNSDQRVCDEIWYILYVHCTEYSADPADAEECVNDTWLHAWNAMPPHRPSLLSTFLGKITRNLSFDLYRKMHRKKRGGSQMDTVLDELEECVSGKDDIERQWEMKELIAEINQFLQKLPEEKRCMFVLRYWYVDSIGEIADRLGRSENYVSVTLNRIRGKLHTHLTERGFEV